MTSQNVALWDINIALWVMFLFIVTQIFQRKDFSSLKNDLFVFQLALLSNKFGFFYAVFGKMGLFGNTISILQLH